MGKLSITFAFCFLLFSSFSQKPTVLLGEPQKKEGNFLKLLPSDDGSIIKYSRQYDNSSKDYFCKATFTKLNPQFQKIKSVSCNDDDAEKHLIKIKDKQNNCFLFGKRDKINKTYNIYYQELDNENLLFNTAKEVAKFNFFKDLDILKLETDNFISGTSKDLKSNDCYYIRYASSKDFSKHLIFTYNEKKTNHNFQFQISVFDANFSKLWSNDFELNKSDENISLQDFCITNSGEVGIFFLERYNEEKLKEIKKSKEDLPSYDTKLLFINNDGKMSNQYLLPFDNKFIRNLDVKNVDNNNIEIFGLYQNSSKKINGYFNIIIDKTAQIVKKEFTPFPNSIISQLLFGKTPKDDAGIPTSFNIVKRLDRDNGSVDYILKSESYSQYVNNTVFDYSTSTISDKRVRQETAFDVNIGDIVDINIKKDGNVSFVRIPLNIGVEKYENCRTYTQCLTNKNKLYLFYNDLKENITRSIEKEAKLCDDFSKSSFIVATIDENGNLTREELFANDRKKYITSACNCNPFAENKLVLYLNDAEYYIIKNEQIGYLEIK